MSTTDIQHVAFQELNRELTKEEMRQLIDKIPDKINWYDIIANCIDETLSDDINDFE